jgi:hypothetical protein
LEVFERRPPTAVFAAPSVISRHPKTFTIATELLRRGERSDVPKGDIVLATLLK